MLAGPLIAEMKKNAAQTAQNTATLATIRQEFNCMRNEFVDFKQGISGKMNDIMREVKEGFANICQQMRAADDSISQERTESQGDIVHASISASRARANLSSMQMENIPQLPQAFTINMGQKMSAMSCIMGWYTAIPNAYFECYPRDKPVTIYVTFVIDKKI